MIIPKQGQPIDDAVDVIAWYYIFIHVKLSRALSGLIKDENDDFGLDDMVDEDGKPFPKDSDGSAKIAIIGIERSISAWSILREHLASEGAAAMGFMTHLLRLRNLVERYFPDARQFHRPGFDD